MSTHPHFAEPRSNGVHFIDPWLRLPECADRAQVHEATLRREIRRGRLRHARIGGRKSIRIRASWLDEWLLASSTPVEAR